MEARVTMQKRRYCKKELSPLKSNMGLIPPSDFGTVKYLEKKALDNNSGGKGDIAPF